MGKFRSRFDCIWWFDLNAVIGLEWNLIGLKSLFFDFKFLIIWKIHNFHTHNNKVIQYLSDIAF